MCGITAIYAFHPAAPEPLLGELRAMRDHMRARGPDGAGEWLSPGHRAALGHRRLSIIDLSEQGAQPMRSTDGKLCVSFNGEIYNYQALRRELEADGAKFVSHSDTEVLLHLYRRYGAEMLPRLRGMFAFALWDEKNQTLLLARDPYGIKPLYYSDDGHTVRAASQVKALLAGGAVSREPDTAGRAGFFLFGSVPEPYTLYRHIRALPAGSYLSIGPNGPAEIKTYFSIAQVFHDAAHSPARTADREEAVREALLDSVRHHLVADVPVGAFLSAGIDSGALTGLMRDAGQDEVQTLTLAFDEFRGQAHDESPLAEEVARLYNTRHSTRVVSREEFRADVPLILAAMDQPSLDGINTWFVSKATRELGLKTAISGVGGDELFGGYPSFRQIPRSVRGLYLPSRIPLLPGLFRRLTAPLLARGPYSPKLAGLLKFGGDYAGAYFLRRGLFMPWELPAVMGREQADAGLQALNLLPYLNSRLQPEPGSPFARVATLEASVYMRNQLLRDTDWAGMAHSLEVRTPLVDSALLQRLAPLLMASPAARSKLRLAHAPSRPLPDSVALRGKTGFLTPINSWLQSLDDLDAWRRVPELCRPHCHWSRRWAYTVLNFNLEPTP